MIPKIFPSYEDKRKALIVLGVLIVGVILLLFLARPLWGIFTSQESVKEYILSYGPYAPIAFISLQIVQVLIAPIPGQVIGFVSGYVFGWKLGIIYTMIGLAIGSFIAFFLSRKLGRPFVEKVVDKEALKKFDYLSTRKGPFALFMLFLLPAFPDDALCFIAGLTAIPLRQLMLIAVVGRFPGMLMLNLVGSGVAKNDATLIIILISIVLIISAFGWWYRKDIEEYYHDNVTNGSKF